MHGGPGNGTKKQDTAFFDPKIYRVVLLDQRGCGRSSPAAEIIDNTTEHLLGDMEILRTHLKITKWAMVFGGSWGSTLALLYAEAHPEMVGSLVLRGVFLGTRTEIEWDNMAASLYYPDIQQAFLADLHEDEHRDSLKSYYNRLRSDDRLIQQAAVKSWNLRESLIAGKTSLTKDAVEDNNSNGALSHALLEAHYFVHYCFLHDGEILDNISRIQHIPTTIVQGRLDLLCPPKWAWELHKALPQSRLYFIDSVGHEAEEPSTMKRLIQTCDEYGNF